MQPLQGSVEGGGGNFHRDDKETTAHVLYKHHGRRAFHPHGLEGGGARVVQEERPHRDFHQRLFHGPHHRLVQRVPQSGHSHLHRGLGEDEQRDSRTERRLSTRLHHAEETARDGNEGRGLRNDGAGQKRPGSCASLQYKQRDGNGVCHGIVAQLFLFRRGQEHHQRPPDGGEPLRESGERAAEV